MSVRLVLNVWTVLQMSVQPVLYDWTVVFRLHVSTAET